MTYSIIGMGAIGGFYGGRLAHAGLEVHFLSHSDYAFVVEHGLQIDSCDGNFHLPHINAYHTSADMPKTDVVIVGLKSVNNHLLPELLAPIITDNTVVVLIQNGIGLEADLQAAFPNLHIVAGLAFICSSKTQPGHINHQCYGSINLGNYSCPPERFSQILEDFQKAGLQVAEVPYEEARWKKAVWNMPFNGMTVALDTSTDKLLNNPATRQLIYDQMMEVIGAANALGIEAITSEFADKMIEMTDAMVPYSPSMKLDYDFHRPMEIYYLYTRPIEEARKAGFEMPKLSMLEAELKFKESQYNKS
ncbi:MAG: 2-dehydropantoate 2-reductase [Prevotella sp.]|jgi:2-dehydropantoate 2-reductase|nr:2-dehydropantoate 2-reductase [Prevotella sp.]